MESFSAEKPPSVVMPRRRLWLIVVAALAGVAGVLAVGPFAYLAGRPLWGLVVATALIVFFTIRLRSTKARRSRLWTIAILAPILWIWGCLFLGVTGLDASLTRAPSNEVMQWAKRSAHRIPRLDTYDQRDWEFLRDVIGDRRIVMLGESNHCVEEYSQAKLNMIRFLHEQLGFNVLAFESYMLPAHQADLDLANGASGESAARSIYQIWNTVTVRRLFNYIRATKSSATPMHVAGFDMKVDPPQEDAFIYSVLESDTALAGRYLRARTQFGPDIWKRLARRDIKSRDALAHRFAAFYGALPAELDQAHARGSLTGVSAADVSLAAQLARNLAAQPAFHDPKTIKQVGLRDSLMAVNIEYLAEEQYPGEKIIVWAHNGHIARAWSETALSDVTNLSLPWLTLNLLRIRMMGEYVSARYGDDVYVVGLQMASGRYKTIYGADRRVRPSRRDSVEYLLHDAAFPASFLDFTRTTDPVGRRWQESQSTVLLEDNWFRIIPERQYDGVLVVSRATPPVK